MFFRFLPLALLFVCPVAHAQTPCGTAVATATFQGPGIIPTNYTSFYNPGPNYNTITLAPGPPGYNDPDLGGCQVIRVTQGDSGTGNDPTVTPPVEHIHAYKYSPINCDDTLELLGSPQVASWELWTIPASTLYRGTPTGLRRDNNAQPLWAHCSTGPSETVTIGGTAYLAKTILYYHDWTGPKIWAYHTDTDTITVIHDFSQAGETACGGGPCTQVCWGCSPNGPHGGIGANIDDNIIISAIGTNGRSYSFDYDIRNARIWPGFTPIDITAHYCGSTYQPSCSSGGQTTFMPGAAFPDHRIGLTPSGTFGAMDIFDATGTFVASWVGVTHNHNEVGKNYLGHDAIYFEAQQTTYKDCTPQPGVSGIGIVELDFVTGQHFCVANVGWYDKHVSVEQTGQWVEVEQYDQGGADACTNAYLNANPGVNWQQYFTQWIGSGPSWYKQEIVLAKTDGSTTYRLAKHRDRAVDNATCSGGLGLGGNYDYWATPKAAMSYDGKYVAFTSNFGVGLQTATKLSYTDEYLVVTGLAGGTATAPAPPTGLTATVH